MQHDDRQMVPEPDALSAAHSERVGEYIRTQIRNAGGSISFAEYMQHALYAPGLGYYSAGSTKFGADGDFITAPEISPIFGRILARQCAEVLHDIRGASILEFGAGSGKLACDILRTLQRLDALPERYEILEVSADLQQRQADLFRAEVPELMSRISWLKVPPDHHAGVIIANEVLDALPVERFMRSAAGIEQLRVTVDGESFGITSVRAPEKLSEAVLRIEQELGHGLPEGFVSEVSLALPGWVSMLARSLSHGLIFLFDYGITRREYYAPERSGGWLRCYFRHHAHDNPLILTGIQDLSAWVDFNAVAEAASRSGLDIAGYTAQAQFLLGGGLDAELQDLVSLPLKEQMELSGQIKTLTLPAEMGEHFKCMAVSRGEISPPSAFSSADRTHTL